MKITEPRLKLLIKKIIQEVKLKNPVADSSGKSRAKDLSGDSESAFDDLEAELDDLEGGFKDSSQPQSKDSDSKEPSKDTKEKSKPTPEQIQKKKELNKKVMAAAKKESGADIVGVYRKSSDINLSKRKAESNFTRAGGQGTPKNRKIITVDGKQYYIVY